MNQVAGTARKMSNKGDVTTMDNSRNRPELLILLSTLQNRRGDTQKRDENKDTKEVRMLITKVYFTARVK
jgi:hypothetical protein